MWINKKTSLAIACLTLSAVSAAMLGDSFRLIAERRVDVLNGIFMLQGCLLLAGFFAGRAHESKDQWPVSILRN